MKIYTFCHKICTTTIMSQFNIACLNVLLRLIFFYLVHNNVTHTSSGAIRAHRVALISISVAVSQTSAHAARAQIRG